MFTERRKSGSPSSQCCGTSTTGRWARTLQSVDHVTSTSRGGETVDRHRLGLVYCGIVSIAYEGQEYPGKCFYASSTGM